MLMINSLKNINIDAAEPEILMFFFTHSSSLSKTSAYITHNATCMTNSLVSDVGVLCLLQLI